MGLYPNSDGNYQTESVTTLDDKAHRKSVLFVVKGDEMGFLGGLLKAAVDVVSIPVAVVADVVTLGDAGATEKTMKHLGNDLEEAGEGLIGNDDFI